MAFIEVINDAGTILIDDNYVNLCLRQKGVLSFPGTTNAGRYVELSYDSPTGWSPLLAINFAHPHTVLAYLRNGNTHKWLVVCPASAGAATGTFYVFDLPQLTLPGTGAIVLWNEQGQVTYDSDGKYMRCRDVIQNAISDQAGSRDYAGGRTYAVVHSSAAYYNELRLGPSPPNPVNPNSPGPWRYVRVNEPFGYSVQGGRVAWQRFTYEGGEVQRASSREGYNFSSTRAACMVLDVSGY